jgi:hypothetical protein
VFDLLGEHNKSFSSLETKHSAMQLLQEEKYLLRIFWKNGEKAKL